MLSGFIKNMSGWNKTHNKRKNNQPMKHSKIDDLTNDELQEMKLIEDLHEQHRHSLFLFSYDGGIRAFARDLTNHKNFEWVMLGIILLSSLELAIDNPLNAPSSIL